MSVVSIDRRELKAVGLLWLFLMLLAISALVILQRNAHRIIYHLEYVSASRYQKALALYAEAEKRTLPVLKKRQAANLNSSTAVAVPKDDPDAKAALELFAKAFATDPRQAFIPEQEQYYKLLGDLNGSVGRERDQQIAYARAAITRRDFVAADSILSRAANAAATDPQVALARAQMLWYSGRKSEVETELIKVPAEQWPADAHAIYARVLQDAGKLPEAAVELESAIKKSNAATDLRKLLAAVYSRMKQQDKAIETLEQGLSAGGDSDGNYLHILGDLYRAAGRNKEAVKTLEAAARHESNSGSVQLSLARAYEASGEGRKASRALQRATTLDPALQGELLK